MCNLESFLNFAGICITLRSSNVNLINNQFEGLRNVAKIRIARWYYDKKRWNWKRKSKIDIKIRIKFVGSRIGKRGCLERNKRNIELNGRQRRRSWAISCIAKVIWSNNS